jgi:hypothetical protein
MALNGIGPVALRRSSSVSRFAKAAAPSSESRALVPIVEITPDEDPFPYFRGPAAPFLAHLIATAQGEPQTRDRRRAEPKAAAQAYEAVSACVNGIISRKN